MDGRTSFWGFELSHFYFIFYFYFFCRGKWNSIRVEWFRFREMFVNHASSTPRWILAASEIKRKTETHTQAPKKDKQKRKKDKTKTKEEAFVITSQRPNASVCSVYSI
jgi:hypothetical protein